MDERLTVTFYADGLDPACVLVDADGIHELHKAGVPGVPVGALRWSMTRRQFMRLHYLAGQRGVKVELAPREDIVHLLPARDYRRITHPPVERAFDWLTTVGVLIAVVLASLAFAALAGYHLAPRVRGASGDGIRFVGACIGCAATLAACWAGLWLWGRERRDGR